MAHLFAFIALTGCIASAVVQAQVTVYDSAAVDDQRGRTVDYRVYAPQSIDGQMPLVLVSHGGTGSFSGFTRAEHLGIGLAQSGYIAIHVGHRPSNSDLTHLIDRPADVSFLLDRLEQQTLDLPEGLRQSIDLERVGHVGHSFGAYTGHALAGATLDLPAISPGLVSFRDERIDAIVLLSPQGADQFGFFDRGAADNSWSAVAVPVATFVGSQELDSNVLGTLTRDNWRIEPFSRYTFEGDKYLSIIFGQDHLDLWNTGSPQVEQYIAQNASLFLDLAIRGQAIPSDDIGASPALQGVTRARKSIDMNGDGHRDFFDVIEFLNAFENGDPAAEATGDRPAHLDSADIQAFIVTLDAE